MRMTDPPNMTWLDRFTKFYVLGSTILSIMTVSIWVFGPLAPALIDMLTEFYFVAIPAWFLVSVLAVVLFRRSILLLASPVSFVIWLCVIFLLAWQIVNAAGNPQQVQDLKHWIPLSFNIFALFYGLMNWLLFLKITKCERRRKAGEIRRGYAMHVHKA